MQTNENDRDGVCEGLEEMSIPKVSIMIPTFNQAKYIVRAIQSAQSQDYGNLEIVVADDHSTDTTKEVVEEFLAQTGDDRIRYFRNSENLGILRNYQNNLYKNSTGDWAINLDGDDFFIDPKFISTAMMLSGKDPQISLIFGNYAEYQQVNGRRVDIINGDHPSIIDDEHFFRAYAANKIFWNHNSIIYRRPEAIRLGFYWDTKVKRNDWESFLRLIVGHKVGYIASIAAAWVQHEANETKRLDLAKYLNNFVLIEGVSRFASDAGMNVEFIENWRRQMLYKSTRGSCIGYIRNRDFSGMVKFLRHAFNVSPILPLKAAFDPSLMARAMLALNPSLYTAVKSMFRKMVHR